MKISPLTSHFSPFPTHFFASDNTVIMKELALFLMLYKIYKTFLLSSSGLK
jgi:hypothetical protein